MSEIGGVDPSGESLRDDGLALALVGVVVSASGQIRPFNDAVRSWKGQAPRTARQSPQTRPQRHKPYPKATADHKVPTNVRAS